MDRGSRDGFALVSALWLIVALSVVALEFSLSGRDRRLAAMNRVESARASAVAESGIEHARIVLERRLADAAQLLLAARSDRDPWLGVEMEGPTGDGPLEGEIADGRYRVRVVDLGARLNVNEADEATMRRLLTAVGIDAGRADRLAQTILDWRDPDRYRRARGAEREDYLEEGALVLPDDAAFGSVGDLRQVRGMRERDYARIESLITVRGSGRVNLSSAPPAVLMALPGMHDEVLALLLEHRTQGRSIPPLSQLALETSPDVRAVLERSLPELVSRTTSDTRELLIESEAWMEGSPVTRTAEAILVRSAGSTFLVDRRTP